MAQDPIQTQQSLWQAVLVLKVCVDGQCLQTASRVRGIGRYVTELLRALEARDDIELTVALNAAMPDAGLLARNTLEQFMPGDRITVWQSLVIEGEI